MDQGREPGVNDEIERVPGDRTPGHAAVLTSLVSKRAQALWPGEFTGLTLSWESARRPSRWLAGVRIGPGRDKYVCFAESADPVMALSMLLTELEKVAKNREGKRR